MRKILLPFSLILNLFLFAYLFFSGQGRDPDIPDRSQNVPEPATSETIIDEAGNRLQSVKIVMLGNSITHAGNWQEVLGREDVFNAGKPGWTSQQLSWVIKNFVIPYGPELCFFKAGINDYTLGIPTERIYTNTCIILDSIHKVGTRPVYTTTLYQRGAKERNREIDQLNEKMRLFCDERGYDFLDLRPFLCEEGDIADRYVQEDNTHLKPNAYPQWAKAMQPILEKYGLSSKVKL